MTDTVNTPLTEDEAGEKDSKPISGLLSLNLRPEQYKALCTGHLTYQALLLLAVTGMRFSELKKVRKSNLIPPHNILIPATKKGTIKRYIISKASYQFIDSQSEEFPFLKRPCYTTLRRLILRNFSNILTTKNRKTLSIINSLRRYRIRESVYAGEPVDRISQYYGHKSKSSISYYL